MCLRDSLHHQPLIGLGVPSLSQGSAKGFPWSLKPTRGGGVKPALPTLGLEGSEARTPEPTPTGLAAVEFGLHKIEIKGSMAGGNGMGLATTRVTCSKPVPTLGIGYTDNLFSLPCS